MWYNKVAMTRNNKKPTIKDVASMAGVSIATVSYVINGKEGQRIPEETKNKIFHAINILGYAPNPHAVAIKTERAKDIILRTHTGPHLCRIWKISAFCSASPPTVSVRGILSRFPQISGHSGFLLPPAYACR